MPMSSSIRPSCFEKYENTEGTVEESSKAEDEPQPSRRSPKCWKNLLICVARVDIGRQLDQIEEGERGGEAEEQ